MGLFNRQFHLFRQPPIGCIALFEWSVSPQRVETGVCCLAPAPKFSIGKAAFGAVCAGMYAYIVVISMDMMPQRLMMCRSRVFFAMSSKFLYQNEE